MSTISVSVARCSTNKILPNHPSPTICKISNSSDRLTYMVDNIYINPCILNAIQIKRFRFIQTFSSSNSRILWMLPCCFLELDVFIFFLSSRQYCFIIRSIFFLLLNDWIGRYRASIAILMFPQHLIVTCILNIIESTFNV